MAGSDGGRILCFVGALALCDGDLPMKTNVGTTDRVLRVVVGILLLALLFVLDGGIRWIGLIGLVPLATAIIGWCPAYTLFGITTCGVEHDRTRPA
jgi:hypothetical protein